MNYSTFISHVKVMYRVLEFQAKFILRFQLNKCQFWFNIGAVRTNNFSVGDNIYEHILYLFKVLLTNNICVSMNY